MSKTSYASSPSRCQLTEQYTALLEPKACIWNFAAEGVARLAEIAFEVNERTENIGARRLHTVLERLLKISPSPLPIKTARHLPSTPLCRQQLAGLAGDEDLTGIFFREYVMSIRPTEINLHKKSRILEIAFEDASASICRRISAREFTLGRSARPRPGQAPYSSARKT